MGTKPNTRHHITGKVPAPFIVGRTFLLPSGSTLKIINIKKSGKETIYITEDEKGRKCEYNRAAMEWWDRVDLTK